MCIAAVLFCAPKRTARAGGRSVRLGSFPVLRPAPPVPADSLFLLFFCVFSFPAAPSSQRCLGTGVPPQRTPGACLSDGKSAVRRAGFVRGEEGAGPLRRRTGLCPGAGRELSADRCLTRCLPVSISAKASLSGRGNPRRSSPSDADAVPPRIRREWSRQRRASAPAAHCPPRAQ